MSRDYKPTKNGVHGHNAISWVLDKVGGLYYLATLAIRPTTATIYNVATAGAGWTAVATGLTSVLGWRLTERSGATFNYCYDGVGTTYMTSFGWITEKTAITAIYVKRTGSVNINMQLEVQTA